MTNESSKDRVDGVISWKSFVLMIQQVLLTVKHAVKVVIHSEYITVLPNQKLQSDTGMQSVNDGEEKY